jgi:glycosyltransferase involved in cell wall biosynthesis
MNKKISVVTVVYNDILNISKTIQSVLSQDCHEKEYIVIDGNSNDGTYELLKNYEKNIDLIISENDKGIYDAMNKSISMANGDYLIFMNSGDIFENPNVLSYVLDYLSKSDSDVLFGRWIRRDAVRNKSQLNSPYPNAGIFNHQAIVYKRNLHNLYGMYCSIDRFTAADYLFFSQLVASKDLIIDIYSETISIIDANGISSGIQTFAQKKCIDFLFGRCNRYYLGLILFLHPFYRFIKGILP